MVERVMKFSKIIFRSWYYFRIGYGTYVAFPLGFASTVIVIHALAVVDVPAIHDIFPHLYMFGIVGLLIIGPISIYAGLYHIKRTARIPPRLRCLRNPIPTFTRPFQARNARFFSR